MSGPLTAPDASFVDGLGVLQALAKQAIVAGKLPDDLKVFTKIPDHQMEYLPLLVINRAGGNSLRPEFRSDFFVHFDVWSDKTDEFPDDPFKAAYELSQKVARVYYRAWQEQTLAYDGGGHVMGWICDWRESSGFQDFTDPDVPHIGRYVGVYDLVIRNRRPRSA